ncbi:L-carnitine dehydrogenase [Methylobrevis pamukkalensis]|uniref:L-carnitine dehydrogenase n=1 Tax=Methylobrevis pamukkalensis TaxID=1439726 RepID=A0A1E3H4I1_9HYPH|nr:L-carnitine dehydrogenase [Methylobrevis pamukkalensis]
MYFAAAGLDVVVHDPHPARWDAFLAERAGLEAEVAALRAGGAATLAGSITCAPDIEDLAPADFVQECAPERIELKRDLLPRIEAAVGDDVVIASSSSALLVTEMQAACTRPERIVLGHPFNPAHLMPLVEVVGGEGTAPWAVTAARDFYDVIGKKPVVLSREITGHLALRLMGAMWREAIALVASGVATAEDVDRAFQYGPGPKWLLQGAFISNALNAAGMAEFLDRYGPTYEAIWDDLMTASLDAPTRAAVVAGTEAAMAGRSVETLKAEREAGLVPLLALMDRQGA